MTAAQSGIEAALARLSEPVTVREILTAQNALYDRGTSPQWVRDELDRIETRDNLARLSRLKFELEC